MRQLPELFVPFVQEPKVALTALKQGIVQNRGRCVPTLKKNVQKEKSTLTKVKRVTFHHTTKSNYKKIVNNNLNAVPIGYVSHILPVGRGPTGKLFPKNVHYGEYCSLFESIIFRCGYSANDIIDRIARGGPLGQKIAGAMVDAKYYWSTIGSPIAKEWIKFGFSAGTGAFKVGVMGKKPDMAFSMDPDDASLGDAKDALNKASDLRSGKWAREIMETCQKNFETFQSFYSKKEAYKVIFSPNEAYISPYNLDKKPEMPHHVPYPYKTKLPEILSRNRLGLVHNFKPFDHYQGHSRFNAFESACPCIVAVTQFTPVLNMNNEIVLAHDKRVIRVREIGIYSEEALITNLNYDYRWNTAMESDINYAGKWGTYFRQFCYPDLTMAPKSIQGSIFSDDYNAMNSWSYKREGAKGVPAYILRNFDKFAELPGWEDLGKLQAAEWRRKKIPINIFHPLTEKGIKHWGMKFEDNDALKQVYRVQGLKNSFSLDDMHAWIIR